MEAVGAEPSARAVDARCWRRRSTAQVHVCVLRPDVSACGAEPRRQAGVEVGRAAYPTASGRSPNLTPVMRCECGVNVAAKRVRQEGGVAKEVEQT